MKDEPLIVRNSKSHQHCPVCNKVTYWIKGGEINYHCSEPIHNRITQDQLEKLSRVTIPVGPERDQIKIDVPPTFKQRVERWNDLRSKPISRTRRIRIADPDPSIDFSLLCLICQKPTLIISSVLARVAMKYGHATLINPSTVDQYQWTDGIIPGDRVSPDGRVIPVDARKDITFPETKVGRVCNDCKDGLHPSSFLPDIYNRDEISLSRSVQKRWDPDGSLGTASLKPRTLGSSNSPSIPKMRHARNKGRTTRR